MAGSRKVGIAAVIVVVIAMAAGTYFWMNTRAPAGSLTDGLVTRSDTPLVVDKGQTAAVTLPVAADEHPLDPALRLAREALEKFQREVSDYTATMIKRERISGTLGGETRMEAKIRTRLVEGDKLVRPMSVYLKMLDPWLARGREVIWVENRNDGKLLAHEGGLKNLVHVSLAPTDRLAMMGNKYPITEIGLAKLMEKLIEKGERDKQVGPCEVTIRSGAEVAGRVCQLIEVKHPERDARFDFHIAQIYLDEERMIPLRYAAYLWPDSPDAAPPLEEEYTYVDVRLNVGLTDADFDPSNSAYQY